jgi:hypothetical protein
MAVRDEVQVGDVVVTGRWFEVNRVNAYCARDPSGWIVDVPVMRSCSDPLRTTMVVTVTAPAVSLK